MTPKRTPAETLEALQDQGADDEMRRVLALSPEARRRELPAAGFDVTDVQAKAHALFERAQRDRLGVRLPPVAAHRRRLSFAVVGPAAVAALIAVALGAAFWRRPEPVVAPIGPDVIPSTPRPESPIEKAAALRSDAYADFDAGRWNDGIAKLDAAASLDPAGDASAEVHAGRRRAAAALEAERQLDRKRP